MNGKQPPCPALPAIAPAPEPAAADIRIEPGFLLIAERRELPIRNDIVPPKPDIDVGQVRIAEAGRLCRSKPLPHDLSCDRTISASARLHPGAVVPILLGVIFLPINLDISPAAGLNRLPSQWCAHGNGSRHMEKTGCQESSTPSLSGPGWAA